jgi:hypothetical protein
MRPGGMLNIGPSTLPQYGAPTAGYQFFGPQGGANPFQNFRPGVPGHTKGFY